MSIKLADVTYVYMKGTPYERTALARVNLEINNGDFVGIIGHTGSGKSTLVQHLNGLLQPTSGQVTVDGVDLHAKGEQAKTARRKVGMVFQYPEHQLFEETIFDDIAFGPRNLGLPVEEIEKRVRLGMDFVGLDYETFRDRSPFRLSGGQMRRVAIAGVIALQPDYLVLDEPSAGLDPRGREEIFSEIVRLHRSTGTTVVLVSHNMEDIARMANRLIVMNHGNISLDDTPAQVFRNGQAELQAAGADIPAITNLMKKLKAQGLAVDEGTLTMETSVSSILTAVRGRSKC